MLELVDIKKVYELKDSSVNALNGISLNFRRSEFVSILGPSGCGKTTLLNIIGGLDRYSSGDLLIDGVSTKNYKDKDWDNYRNHRVGFVFQNYNLIPHQTILENVELALTLSGIKKVERRERAIKVLTDVGLGDKLKSKPNQLSGGQMQRVAIARALVNDPEIILADEPTGALDSKTSVQIMELLKQVSRERLVIMVTHNPELADQYSDRIIRLLDGELKSDSKSFSKKDSDKEIKKYQKIKQKHENVQFKKTDKKKSMSFLTALFLSFRNLLTKKGRTFMVAFAGSIGIIGISLILAVSNGMTSYINRMQSESLSSYPISISSVSVDISNVSSVMSSENQKETEDDEVAVYDMLETLKNFGEYNYLSFEFVNHVKNYCQAEDKKNKINALNISYASDMHLITNINSKSISEQLEDKEILLPINNVVTFSAMSGTTSSTFFEELNNREYILSLYDIKGTYPANKNEIALVLNSDSISNSSLSGLGIDVPTKNEDGKYNSLKFDDIIGQKQYRLILNDRYYNPVTHKPNLDFDALNQMATFAPPTQASLTALYGGESEENTLDLTITCVLTLKDDASGSIFSDGLMYTNELAEFYRNDCKNSQIVNEIKTKYTYDNENFVNGDDEFYKNYVVRISELDMVNSMMGGNLDANSYNYTSPNAMKNRLKEYFDITLTPEQVIDLYLQTYGASDVPTGIYVYVNSFEAKEDFEKLVNDWNNKEGVCHIYFTDSSTMLTNMLSSIVNIISYVLIAFAAISLVVSSLMIAIITYTSVIERIKEIGVLRSVGASKRDISRVFNSEAIIIGLLAGVIGVAVAALITIPINLILGALTGISGLAQVNIVSSLILVAISVGLTFIAGLIPANIASKKDPVVALRSE